MASCLPLLHTHCRPACWATFSTGVCLCVLMSICDLIDDVSVHVLCCVGVIVCVLFYSSCFSLASESSCSEVSGTLCFCLPFWVFSQSFGFSFSQWSFLHLGVCVFFFFSQKEYVLFFLSFLDFQAHCVCQRSYYFALSLRGLLESRVFFCIALLIPVSHRHTQSNGLSELLGAPVGFSRATTFCWNTWTFQYCLRLQNFFSFMSFA